jgi:hypothetical protein
MSYTVTIPGGTAELLERTELTARRQRAIEVITLQSPSLIKKMNSAGKVKTPDGQVIDNPDTTDADALPEIELDEKEATLFFRIQDATLYAMLKSWTLPQPTPETVDAVQDLPAPVYAALMQGVKDAPSSDAASFAPNDASVEDKASPFGNSEPSPAP